MKAVLISINKPHTDNIIGTSKTSELRTKAPCITTPFKVYIYETKRYGGCGKVIGEFTCFDKPIWRMCMGIPAHMTDTACITEKEIWDYCHHGEKDITEIRISTLRVYDTPKELSEFYKFGGMIDDKLTRPPQSWCYVEELKE